MPNDTKGFASLSAERRREIAQLGGRAAHKKGRAHEWSSAEAAIAGRKGGLNRRHSAQDATGATFTRRAESTLPSNTDAARPESSETE
jgi:general stress protein YciG